MGENRRSNRYRLETGDRVDVKCRILDFREKQGRKRERNYYNRAETQRSTKKKIREKNKDKVNFNHRGHRGKARDKGLMTSDGGIEKMEEIKKKTIVYNGPSMRPLFKPGDVLTIEAYELKEIKKGDVIVFKPGEGDELLVHRVVKLSEQGIKAQGDNNRALDPWDITLEQVLGKVIAFNRGNQSIKVRGGFLGQVSGFSFRFFKKIKSFFFNLLHPLYHKGAGVFARAVTIKQIVIERSNGKEYQLLVGKKIVGRLPSGEKEWLIKRPYRLFIDKKIFDVESIEKDEKD